LFNNYNLLQNYPNPYNPVTNFEFQIKNLGLVSLKIYDILGNEVATIVNEELTTGTYKTNGIQESMPVEYTSTNYRQEILLMQRS